MTVATWEALESSPFNVSLFVMIRQLSILALAGLATAAWSQDTVTRGPSPAEDFYGFVNADWLRQAEIPSEVPWISPFVVNTLRTQQQIREIVEEAAGVSSASGSNMQIGAFYRSYVDLNAIENAGLRPLEKVFDDIDAVSTKSDIVPLFGRLAANHTDFDPNSIAPSVVPVQIGVWNDRFDATRTALVLHPGGLSLPDRTYYLDRAYAETLAQFQDHIEAVFALAGSDDPQTNAATVIQIETELARARLPEEALHDPEATWNSLSSNKIDDKFSGFQVTRLVRVTGFDIPENIVVTEPDYFVRLGQLLDRLTVEDWRSYLKWQVLRRYSGHLPKAFRDAEFDFHGRVMMGNEVLRPREELGSLAVEAAFPNTIGRLWTERHVDPRTKSAVLRIAQAVRSAFAARIKRNQRYAADTKAAALEKLEKLHIEIAYPDVWDNDVGDRMDRTDLIGNLVKLSTAATKEKIARLERPVDRHEWYSGPQETSGYYVRSTNSLVIPAGVLQAPWYEPDASMAKNFGGVGTVIGHEMGHAFDNQGARFDAFGNLRNWWTPDDAKVFAEETAKLIRQYESFEAMPGITLNGSLTVSEAYGDLIGLTVAYEALLAEHPSGRDPNVLKDYLNSFCTHWRAKYREPLLKRIIASDGHAPQRFRCNGPVSAFTPFYEEFDVEPSDPMYLEVDERSEPY